MKQAWLVLQGLVCLKILHVISTATSGPCSYVCIPAGVVAPLLVPATHQRAIQTRSREYTMTSPRQEGETFKNEEKTVAHSPGKHADKQQDVCWVATALTERCSEKSQLKVEPNFSELTHQSAVSRFFHSWCCLPSYYWTQRSSSQSPLKQTIRPCPWSFKPLHISFLSYARFTICNVSTHLKFLFPASFRRSLPISCTTKHRTQSPAFTIFM